MAYNRNIALQVYQSIICLTRDEAVKHNLYKHIEQMSRVEVNNEDG